MKYRITLTHEAQRQLLETSLWWSENRDPEQAVRWLDGFEAAIRELATKPERQPRAYEAEHFDYPLYQLTYGVGRRPTHRAVFRIRSDLVEVVAIRHLAQDELSEDDI